ncbi:MAG: hypothetical protein JWN51_3902 [Phycisphaerales bacterium]|nr:hypothetical protein [Phycisphaerales bacterium]
MRQRILLGLILACATTVPIARAQVKPPEAEAREAAEKREESRMKAVQERVQERLRRERAVAIARNESDQAYEQLLKVQSELRTQTGRADVSPEGLQKAASRLDEEMESLMLDEVGSKARVDALAKTIAEQTNRAKDIAKQDDAAAQLMAVVDVREKQLARVQQLYKSGAAPLAEVQQAEASLAEAKATAAERRRALVAASAGDGVAVWNHELLNLSIAEKERQARMAYIAERLKRLSESMPKLEQLQNLREAVKAARIAVLRAQERLEEYHESAAPGTERQEGNGVGAAPRPPSPAKESQ